MRFHTSVLSAALVLSHAAVAQRHIPKDGYREWKVYGGGPESTRYSTLDQINRDNVRSCRSPGPTTRATFSKAPRCNAIRSSFDGVLYRHHAEIARDRPRCRHRQAALELRSQDAKRSRKAAQSRRDVLGRRPRSADLRGPAIISMRSTRARGTVVTALEIRAASTCARAWAAIPESISMSTSTPGIIYQDLLILGGTHDAKTCLGARRHPRL